MTLSLNVHFSLFFLLGRGRPPKSLWSTSSSHVTPRRRPTWQSWSTATDAGSQRDTGRNPALMTQICESQETFYIHSIYIHSFSSICSHTQVVYIMFDRWVCTWSFLCSTDCEGWSYGFLIIHVVQMFSYLNFGGQRSSPLWPHKTCFWS